MTTNSPFIFITNLFSSVISECKYAPGASNMNTSCFSTASIMSVSILASVDTVGYNMVDSFFNNHFFLIPFNPVIPLIFPGFLLFNKIDFFKISLLVYGNEAILIDGSQKYIFGIGLSLICINLFNFSETAYCLIVLITDLALI